MLFSTSLTKSSRAFGMQEIYLVQTKAGHKGIPKSWKKSSSTKASQHLVIMPYTHGSDRRLYDMTYRRWLLTFGS